MTVRREELSEEARRAFDTWVKLGFSEESAMQQVRRDDMIPEHPYDRRVRK